MHSMWRYALVVYCMSLHLKIVFGVVQHLTLAIFVVYGEHTVVRAWHLYL